MPYTLKEAAQAAIDVQNACNLSGVLHTFEDIVANTLWPEARALGEGTDWVNQHPICTLFLDKLTSLNRSQCLCSAEVESFRRAYAEVRALACAGEEVAL